MAEREENKIKMTYLDIVKHMVEETKFGMVSIVIQDGKVVQIEQNKKIRLKS